MLNFVVAILKYFDLSYIYHMDVLKEKTAVLLDFFPNEGAGEGPAQFFVTFS